MKNRLYILSAIVAISLTTTALAQDFNTGSALMNTGSAYSSNVYGVGAASIDPMASTTANGPMRRSTMSDEWEDTDVDPGNPLPIGAPYVMLLFAAGAAGVVALRRRKQQA